MFYRTTKSRINGFEFKYFSRRTKIAIQGLMIFFGFLLLNFASTMIFSRLRLSPDVTLATLIILFVILFYWMLYGLKKDEHYYCGRAIKDINTWLDIWQKAGVPNRDEDLNKVRNEINLLKKHFAEADRSPRCDLTKDFYAKIRKLIEAINAKTFYPEL